MTGNEYSDLIYEYIRKNFCSKYGLLIKKEVRLGVTLNGTRRRVDILLCDPDTQKYLVIECKYQGTSGTAYEKLDYALRDLEACPFQGLLIYGGEGLPAGICSRLRAHPSAVYCLPGPTLTPEFPLQGDVDHGTWQLDDFLAIHFGIFDAFAGSQLDLFDQ